MKILFCKSCNAYTLEALCKNCGKETFSRKPAKFSLGDRLGKWRRIYKKHKVI